jgi:hypothetical protein
VLSGKKRLGIFGVESEGEDMSWKELSLVNQPKPGNGLALQDVETDEFIENFIVTNVRMVPPNVGAFLQDKEKIHVYLDNESTLDSDFGDMGWDIKLEGDQRIAITHVHADYRCETPVVLLQTCLSGFSKKEKIRRSKWMVQKK